jgi:hypothetical protein
MTDQEFDYRSVRRRVIRRLFVRGLFWANFALFVVHYFISIRWGLYASWITVTWGLFLAIHFTLAFNIIGRLVDRATRREIERLRRQGYTVADPEVGSKLKRNQVARLVDDGEVVFEDEAPPERRRRQSQS